jgi:hypothetical protein
VLAVVLEFREVKKRELAEVTRKLNGIIDAISDGLRATTARGAASSA